MTRLTFWAHILVALSLCFSTRSAHAELLQAPVGGSPIALEPGRVACAAPSGWTLEGGGTLLRPPTNPALVGQVSDLKTAATEADCSQTIATDKVLTTAPWPKIDPASVVLIVDEARVEARGKGLRGTQLLWRTANGSGTDACMEPGTASGIEHCSWVVGSEIPADPTAITLRIVPMAARLSEGSVLFDNDGQRTGVKGVQLPIERIIINQLLPTDASVDLSTGNAEIPLLHPEAVASSECGAVQCATAGGKLRISGSGNWLTNTDVRLHLLPHVFLLRGSALEAHPLARLPVFHCRMAIISGPPLRGAESAKVVVHIDEPCATDATELRFLAGSDPVQVIQRFTRENGADIVLNLGPRQETEITISALRGTASKLVAVARSALRPPLSVHARLELPGYPRIDFIPSNRPARVVVPKLDAGLYLELLSVEGAYIAKRDEKGMTIQGESTADGLTPLRFAVRSKNLPESLRSLDLATFQDTVARGVHEANIPLALGTQSQSRAPLIEVLCGSAEHPIRIHPGETPNVPFLLRDTCRVVLHRERTPVEAGDQKLALAIDVFSADGSARSEGHVNSTVHLRAGANPRHLWIRGVLGPFDRIVVRIAHDPDEAHYIKGSDVISGSPAAQWSAILGTGNLRLYATSAIPTGLYRFGSKQRSGPLSLNFGVISRLTWLTDEGHEWPIGLEGGIMVLGLAGSTSTTGQSLTEVGAVTGVGLSVPIANRNSAAQASINLHGWVEFPFSQGSRPAFIFGPSISIGNVGATL